MNSDEYLSYMQERLVANFDIAMQQECCGIFVDLLATHNRTTEKYFFTKKINLYRIANDEYVLFKKVDEGGSVTQVGSWFKKLSADIPKFLDIGPDHMSSVVSFVLVADKPISAEIIQFIEKAKYHKDFRFTLRGWVDLAIIAVDLENKNVVTNKFGKKIADKYKWCDLNKK